MNYIPMQCPHCNHKFNQQSFKMQVVQCPYCDTVLFTITDESHLVVALTPGGEGQVAAKEGKYPCDNPYKYGSFEYQQWLRGFEAYCKGEVWED